MSEEATPPHWPQYPPGIPVASVGQSRLLMKAIKNSGKMLQRRVRTPKMKKGLIAKDEVAIKHQRPRFW